jgi:hypothetical protein
LSVLTDLSPAAVPTTSLFSTFSKPRSHNF